MYAIEIPLLLMFYFFSRTIVHSISTCHTKVYMNNDFVLFHVEEEELIEPAASQFCMKHLVDHTECQRIIQYHKEHCFQEQNETTTAPSSSSENEKQPNDEVIMPTQTIDYTQKKGPILQIFRVDGTLTANLQAVVGETREQSIIRFCGMLKMNDNECHQVAEKYDQLLKEEQTISFGENHDKKMDNGDSQGNFDTTMQQEKQNDLITFWNLTMQQAGDMINYWWKWFILVVAIYYCYLIQQPQLFRDGGWED